MISPGSIPGSGLTCLCVPVYIHVVKKLFHFFIDGMGLAPAPALNISPNPVETCFYKAMGGNLLVNRNLPLYFPDGRGVLIAADPLQGVDGIPQSATGQTSLFTGINAQKKIGMHLTAFPNSALVEIIRERNLMKVLKERGVSVTSANLYSKEFFEKRGGRRKNSYAVSTLSIQSADIPFRFLPEYHEKKALFADITNSMIRERGFDIPLRTPEEGAEVIFNILKDYDAVFFEYFMTDVFGHKRNFEELRARADELSCFLDALLKLTDGMDDLLILICSDHGNAEDITRGEHTLNAVPVILFTGDTQLQKKGAGMISQLTDVYDFALDYFAD